MDNPVFYVQMAHARLRSIERRAAELGVDAAMDQVQLTRLSHERELDVLRVLSTLPDVLTTACADRAPHRVATWVRELAGAVHGFYHDCYVPGRRHGAGSDPGPVVAGGGGRDRPGRRAGPARRGRPGLDVTRVPRSLLPDSAEVDPEGHLHLGGCDTLALAAEFGTPLFVYDEEQLRARCAEAVTAFGPGVSYATKAFLCRAMARLAHEAGMHLDVSTSGEYHVARAAGVPPIGWCCTATTRRSTSWARPSPRASVCVVVDSFDELDRIEALVAGGALAPPKVLMRITPGVEAHTHEFVRTGQDDSKFGFGVASGAAAEALARAAASDAVELVGMHAHLGSQVFEARFFELAIDALAPFFVEHPLGELSIGGGLGVAYVEGEQAPSITEWADAVHRACARAGITARVTAEPGGPSWPPLPSPSTRWAPSRSCPASAPTCRSTAG